jgi:hypothetical protein
MRTNYVNNTENMRDTWNIYINNTETYGKNNMSWISVPYFSYSLTIYVRSAVKGLQVAMRSFTTIEKLVLCRASACKQAPTKLTNRLCRRCLPPHCPLPTSTTSSNASSTSSPSCNSTSSTASTTSSSSTTIAIALVLSPWVLVVPLLLVVLLILLVLVQDGGILRNHLLRKLYANRSVSSWLFEQILGARTACCPRAKTSDHI